MYRYDGPVVNLRYLTDEFVLKPGKLERYTIVSFALPFGRQTSDDYDCICTPGSFDCVLESLLSVDLHGTAETLQQGVRVRT